MRSLAILTLSSLYPRSIPTLSALYPCSILTQSLLYPRSILTDISCRGDAQDLVMVGGALAGLGDIDGDGVGDLAVGAYRDDDGGLDPGAVYLFFLNTDGTVKDEKKLSASYVSGSKE